MKRQITKIYDIGDQPGIYTVLKYEGLIEIKGRKNQTFDHFFEVKCVYCDTKKSVPQKILKHSEKGAKSYCYACPPEIRRKIEKIKRKEYDAKRESKYDLNESDFNLYKLALFKQKAVKG